MADLCLDEYTDHGHCGLLTADGRRSTTTPPSSATPRSPWPRPRPASTSCAPSGMMDGQVLAIRDALDDDGFERGGDPGLRGQVRLGALRPVPRRGRRRASPTAATARATSRTRPTSASRSRRSALDIGEGADMVMVKPALDLPRRASPGPVPRSTCRSRPTTCPASTRWSRPRPSGAGSTATPSALEQLTAIKPRRRRHDPHLPRPASSRKGSSDRATRTHRTDEPADDQRRALRAGLAHIPGGVNSPVRAFRSVGGTPYFVARGAGRPRLGRRGHPLHRLRAELRRVDPRSRPPRR